MEKNIINIFSESPCLNQQQMMDYLGGRLSEEEKSAVEHHLSDCDLCSDALEGLTSIAHKEQIPVIVQQIHGQLRKELQSHHSRRKKLRSYAWLAVVAIIILIILLVGFFAILNTQSS